MEQEKVADRKRAILKLLEDSDSKVNTVVLHGEAGVGKTWTAREVSNIAKRRGSFKFVLWIYLNREYDESTLLDSIVQQLSLLPNNGICEVEEDENESKKEEKLKPDAVPKKLARKKVLLVLDDEGSKMNEEEVKKLLNNIKLKADKFLITTRNDPTTNIVDERKLVKVQPMVTKESLSLLKERALLDHKIKIDALGEAFLSRTKDMPNAIVVMAKAFKYFFNKENGGEFLLRRSLEEPSDSKIYNVMDLLRSGYDLVPYSLLIDCQRKVKKKFFSDSWCINHNELIAYWMMEGYLGPVSCMETAYRKGHEILMELLDFQILKRLEADYVTINPLNEEFDDFLSQKASDYYRYGYYVNARLGLDNVLEGVDWKGLVRMSHKGGMMRTLPGAKDGNKVSALLLDGNTLAKDLPSKFISSIKELQALAIFNPTVDMLSPFSHDTIKQLHVFILRSCRFMKDMNCVHNIGEFKNLTVLEVSGPAEPSESGPTVPSESGSCSLYDFPKTFFSGTPKLQSLNLSSLPFTSLPESLYELGELKWLILRHCTSLKSLNTLRNCKSLVVLDCSGSTSLEEMQDRSFMNLELQIINLSNTKVRILPLIGNLKKLTHLLLSHSSINRLRNINNVTSLEVIDLSYAIGFNEFHDQSLENLVNLKILDLSGTGVFNILTLSKPRHLYLDNCTQLKGKNAPECLGKIKTLERFVLSNAGIESLPLMSHLTNLRQLLVTNCEKLEEFPDLSSLENMEELDFSGCKSIKSIQDDSFNKMSRLQKLNLSGTSIESLPSMTELVNLRSLLLKDCEELKTLPAIESKSLEKLEELNLCGCKSLENIAAHFFDGTLDLHILNISEAQIKELPSLSGLKNLHELHLRNCKGLKSVPNLESLSNLEILDLSGSAVSDLPILSSLSKLQQLILKNCSQLRKFQELGTTLNGLGASFKSLPYGISELTCLERLDLPTMDDSESSQSKGKEKSDAKSDGCEWGISNLSALNEKRPSIRVSGTQFLQPLVKNPELWESKLKKFHLAVYPIKEVDEKSVLHFQGDDFVYRDVYLQNKHIEESEDQRLLTISGFVGHKADDIDAVLGRANQLLFINNKNEEITKKLSSFLTVSNSKQIKGCWIEKCSDKEVIFGQKEIEKILDLLNSVHTLSVSNAMSLESLFGEFPENTEVFQNLEKLCVEYCPEISTVSSLPQMPRKLKTLKIKYCDKLGKVFETSQEFELLHLETLHLWELPELQSIGCRLPALKTLKISNCPNLQDLEKIIETAENLQNLSISNVVDLETVRVSKQIKYVSIGNCPKLEKIIASSQLANDLEIRIKFCKKLDTVFEKGASLIILKKLHLHGLPKLKSIGATFPKKADIHIVDCQIKVLKSLLPKE